MRNKAVRIGIGIYMTALAAGAGSFSVQAEPVLQTAISAEAGPVSTSLYVIGETEGSDASISDVPETEAAGTETVPEPQLGEAPQGGPAEAALSAAPSAEQTGVSGIRTKGQEVADYAVQFVGNPYRYGGTSLTNGADCSGFVQSVYRHFGIQLPRTSGEQAKAGTDMGTDLANAKPGDMICYSGHIGIYIGDGKIVHASTAKTGIKISGADYKPVRSIRRLV